MTQADFETMVSDLEAQQGPADLSRRAIGDNFAQLLMLSQQATANGLATSPEVLRQLALDRTQILSNAEFARLKAQAKPTPEEIQSYYSAHLADYDVVEVRRVFIWKKSEATKDGRGVSPEEAKALAAAIRQAYDSGSDPKKVMGNAQDVVLDAAPIAFQRGELPPQMEKVAFALKEGEWGELGDTPESLVLLQLTKRSRRELAEVSPSIEKKLLAQKLRAELEDLKKKTGIWMDEQYFAAPKPVSDAQSKAAVPTNPEAKGEKDEDKRQK